MKDERLGLIYQLSMIVNQNKPDDADWILAKYFLENYTKLGKMNIYDLAEECFVSRSSVRRFCQNIGYENFKDLKDDFKKYDYQYNYFMQLTSNENYRAWMAGELAAMVAELNARMDTDEIERIADRIHDSNTVVFLSSYSSIMCLMEFQRPLILSGKLVRIITDTTLDENLLNSLDGDDLAFMVSATGSYAHSMTERMRSIKAYKIFLTTSRDKAIEEPYDKVYHLSAKDYSDVKSVYSKYGLEYFFDVLYSTYVRKYGKNTNTSEKSDKK